MRKVFSALAVAAAATTLAVVDAGTASALGGEQLGCYVSPTRTYPQASPDYCYNNSMPASSYTATFQVMNLNGSYSYAWSVPALYASKIVSGCTSSSSTCVLGNLTPTKVITVSVTISQSGQSSSLEATADIEPWCGNDWCG
jgi:hypothetical protein